MTFLLSCFVVRLKSHVCRVSPSAGNQPSPKKYRRLIKIEYEQPPRPNFIAQIHSKRRKYFVDLLPILHSVSFSSQNCNHLCGVPARSKSVIPGEGNPGSGSLRSPRSMERPLKAGWLKKQQRGLVKNWHQRYFVLRGSTLTQHKDDKETAIQVRPTYTR